MLDQDETAVIAAVRRGDRERFRVLVERHHDTLFSVLVRLLADPVLADELALLGREGYVAVGPLWLPPGTSSSAPRSWRGCSTRRASRR